MIKLTNLNSEGSSSSSHNSSRNSLEFASPLSQTFSPTKSPPSITGQSVHFNNEKPSLKLVLKKCSDNQYQIKNLISTVIYSDTTAIIPRSITNETKPIQFESNLKTRPKRHIPVKHYSREVFATTSEESNDKGFVESCSRPRKRKLIQIDSNNNGIKKSRTKTTLIKRAPLAKTLLTTKAKPVPIKIYCDQKAEVLEPFFKCDLHYKGFEEKVKILLNAPKTVIEMTNLGLALCEEGSNVIRSKAILHFHLFISNTTPCIFCPYCNIYLSVNEFSKHIHVTIDDIDDPFDADEKKAANKILNDHKFNILPYAVNGELNKFELEIWEAFSQKYLLYKNKAKKSVDPLMKNGITTNTDTKQILEKAVQSKEVKTNKSTKTFLGFSSALSDDEFDIDCTKEANQKHVSPERSLNLIDLSNFKEDILLSEEE